MAKDKDSTSFNHHKYKRRILHSPHTFHILLRIYYGYRPSQIAEQLGISPQLINYYTNNLIDLNLIEKLGDRHGLVWKLTSRGLFILKQKLSRSVNCPSSHSSSANIIPIRMHNLTFSFDIISMDKNQDLRLRWQPINNGVLKCFIKYPNYTLELTKSPNGSVLEVHLSEEYVFDPLQGLLKQYDLARYYASLAAQRLRLVISDNGNLVKRPHMAFEYDVIALYLASFQTAETTTKGGKAWIDASKGNGELETNDINYTYKYLTMPENIVDIHDTLNWLKRKSEAGYATCYDPTFTNNN
jgi:DNA-binding MarR family transcriptional regulator